MGSSPSAPTDLRTFARKPTIPQEVTDVSIYDKGPGTPRRIPRLLTAVEISPSSGGVAGVGTARTRLPALVPRRSDRRCSLAESHGSVTSPVFRHTDENAA